MKTRFRSLPASGYCLVAIFVLVAGWGGPAYANGTKKTVTTLTTIYKPLIDNEPSDYVRVVIDGLDKTTVDSAKIQIKRAKQTFDYTVVPLNNIASALPKVGKAMKKPGRIDFRLPLTYPDPKKPKDRQTFKQGDEVTLTINYNKDFSNDPAKGKYQPESAIFRSGTSAVVNEDVSKPILVNGFMYTLDPVYSAFNDLDESLYGVPGTHFEIRNLRFFSNVDEAFVTGFEMGALLSDPYDPTLPHFALGSSEDTPCLAPSSQNLSSCMEILNAFPEPDPGLFVMTVGQLFDIEDGIVVATFMDAVQAAQEVSEPPVAVLFFLALVIACRAGHRSRLTRGSRHSPK